jgi:hypothetical protein
MYWRVVDLFSAAYARIDGDSVANGFVVVLLPADKLGDQQFSFSQGGVQLT